MPLDPINTQTCLEQKLVFTVDLSLHVVIVYSICYITKLYYENLFSFPVMSLFTLPNKGKKTIRKKRKSTI